MGSSGRRSLIWLGDLDHGRKIATLAGADFDCERNPVISRVDEEGNFLGGVIYTDYTGASIRIHVAGVRQHWATPTFLWVTFDYPFNQLQVDKILVTVKSTDTYVLGMDLRLGFKEIFRIPGAVSNGDLVLLSMSREECKWLKLRQLAAKEIAA